MALVPFLIALYLTPEYFKKYNVELLSQETSVKKINHYHDLDSDGNSELIRFTTYGRGERAYIQIYNLYCQLEDVYILPGNWSNY